MAKFIPIIRKEVKVDKQLVDKLTIYLPFQEIRDYKAKKFKAELTLDMSAVVITTPTVPPFLFLEAGLIHDRKLSVNLCFLKVVVRKNEDDTKMEQYFPFVFWELAFEGKRRCLEINNKDDSDDINNAFKCMIV
jgi:hypothetical protein